MRSRRTLALALIGSTHVSLCAGSVLSVLLVLLANAAGPSAPPQSMTPAIGGSMCLLETPADTTAQKTEKSACTQGEQCFTSSALSIHIHDLLPAPPLAETVVFSHQLEFFLSPRPTKPLVLHHPPGHAQFLAMSTVRRE